MAHERTRRVVIIGGGFAGVTAARDLQRRGIETVLLEARDRLGGRTWTTEREGWTVELGGTWIHWSQPFVWSEVQRYGLALEETPGAAPERMVLKLDGSAKELDEQQLGEFLEGFGRFFAEAPTVWERPYDSHFCWDELAPRDARSVADRLGDLDLSGVQAASLRAFLEGLAMAPAEVGSYVEMMRVFSLSGLSYPLMADSLLRYKLVDGTKSLIDAMAGEGGFAAELEAAVASVRHDASGVCIGTSDGREYEADAAVVTVPMNVLKDVRFEPSLSTLKLQASQERHAGGGFKVFLEIEGDPGRLMTLAPASESPLGACLTYRQGTHRSLLVGFSIDEAASSRTPSEWGSILGEFLPGVRVTNAFGHAWGEDPLSQGTWCTYKPGQLTRFADELARTEGRLYFAGADHGEGWRGFIDGAIGSGARAANTLVQDLC